MPTSRTTTSSSPTRPRRRLLGPVIGAAVLAALVGTCCVGQLVVYLLLPHGALYPHDLLSRLGADYQAWQPDMLALIPPPNPAAALAAERDQTSVASELGVVPVAVLGVEPAPSTTPTPAAPAATLAPPEPAPAASVIVSNT